MQGNCTGPPSAVTAKSFNLPRSTLTGMRDMKPSQCVMVIDKPAFLVFAENNKWFDNLHVAIVRNFVTSYMAAIALGDLGFDVGMNLFLSNLTIQGEGPRSARALEVLYPFNQFRGIPDSRPRFSLLIQGVKLSPRQAPSDGTQMATAQYRMMNSHS